MSAAQRKAQTTALIALLLALPEQQRVEVLTGLAMRGLVVMEQESKHGRRVCGVCGLPYPLCRSRRLADDDHEFEAVTKR